MTAGAPKDRVDELERELALLRAALEESERLRGRDADALTARQQFVALIAHELRSPVQTLLLQLDATVRLSTDRERDQEWFRARAVKSLDNVRNLSTLIDRLLDLSGIEDGKLHLTLEELDLVAVARDAIDAMADELRWAKCDVELSAPERLDGVWDRMRVQSVITNLVGNARKYGAGGAIVVTLSAGDGEARIVVRDHGPGIAPEHQARIFEPFERIVSAAGPRISGMGLGLWIVRQFIEAHGGRIAVQNAPGAGAEFTVVLPLRPPR